MPKLGMGPIRREQICRAAAVVIAREGFAGSTMRMVAEEAGVSTGMLNHYFANRQDLLTQALIYVSERTQERYRVAIEDVPAGRERLYALLDSALADDEQMVETWRVWINAYGEAVRLPELSAHDRVAFDQLVRPDRSRPRGARAGRRARRRSPGAGASTRSLTGLRSRR